MSQAADVDWVELAKPHPDFTASLSLFHDPPFDRHTLMDTSEDREQYV